MVPEGFPRNLGEPTVSTEIEYAVDGGISNRKVPWPWREAPARPGSENTVLEVVPPTEGNEVPQEERWVGGASHNTWETGEPAPGDPVNGRGCRRTELLEGKMTETSISILVST